MKASMVFGPVQIAVEGDAKACFAELASAAEVFGQSSCGKCGSEHVVPVSREVDGNTYYEMKCKACGACLSFGQRKVGGALFPRKKKDEQWLPNNGWVDFRSARATQEADQPF